MSQREAAESSSQVNPQVIDGKERSPLDEVLRQGARQMLVKAVEAEVTAYIETPSARSRPGRPAAGGAQRSRPRAHHRQRRGSAEDPGAAGPLDGQLIAGGDDTHRIDREDVGNGSARFVLLMQRVVARHEQP